jgi:adenylylsulfate reductase subunit B
MKRFKFPIRTTPEGSIEPYANKPKVNMDDIDKPGFFNMGSELKGDRSQLICL